MHVCGELDDWHPAIGRGVNSTNDLDMLLRDIVGSYYPPGIGPNAMLHVLLKDKKPGR